MRFYIHMRFLVSLEQSLDLVTGEAQVEWWLAPVPGSPPPIRQVYTGRAQGAGSRPEAGALHYVTPALTRADVGPGASG